MWERGCDAVVQRFLGKSKRAFYLLRCDAGRYRFNVLRDAKDPDVYSFYAVYEDDAALAGLTEAVCCETVFPADHADWT